MKNTDGVRFFERLYMELLNDRIKEFNNGFMIPMDRKENLKNF